MKKSMPMAKKNDSRPANSSMSRPLADCRPYVLEPVGDRERELLDRVAPPPACGSRRSRSSWNFGIRRGVLDDVGHDPHARLGRVDVGVADMNSLRMSF
jgi:hypothetical protein